MPTQVRDKNFRVKVRLQGNLKAGQMSIGLTLPIDIAREVTGGGTNQEVWDKLQNYEFEAEVTSEGILFKPFKITLIEGW